MMITFGLLHPLTAPAGFYEDLFDSSGGGVAQREARNIMLQVLELERAAVQPADLAALESAIERFRGWISREPVKIRRR